MTENSQMTFTMNNREQPEVKKRLNELICSENCAFADKCTQSKYCNYILPDNDYILDWIYNMDVGDNQWPFNAKNWEQLPVWFWKLYTTGTNHRQKLRNDKIKNK